MHAISTDDKEIELLCIKVSRQATEGTTKSRAGINRDTGTLEQGYRLAWDDYTLPRVTSIGVGNAQKIARVMEELRSLHSRMDELSEEVKRNKELPQSSEQLYIFTKDIESEKRIENARITIPMFDRSNEEKLKGFLRRCSYAYRKVQFEVQSEENVQAIICTKLTDCALTKIENRNLTTFQQLKETLKKRAKKTTAQFQREFNNLREKKMRVYTVTAWNA